MSASEKLKALDGKLCVDEGYHEYDSFAALPQIVAVVEAAERAVPVIAQGERAMQELVWTQRDVTARGALRAALYALESALS